MDTDPEPNLNLSLRTYSGYGSNKKPRLHSDGEDRLDRLAKSSGPTRPPPPSTTHDVSQIDNDDDDDDDDDSIDEIVAEPMMTRKAAFQRKARVIIDTDTEVEDEANVNVGAVVGGADQDKNKSDQSRPSSPALLTRVSPRRNNTSGLPEIDQESERCLESGRMLNDTIVEFYMNYLMSKTDNSTRNRFHLFNTFFFNKLKSLQMKAQANRNSESCFRDTIKRWDKNVKLSEKKFLVMPICDHHHWLLVIICHPNNVPAQDEPLVVFERSQQKAQSEEPCILIFDSLGYKQMSKFTEPIRSFLTYRWLYEKPNEKKRIFHDRLAFKDINAKIPKQRNSYDCGIHMLISFEGFLNFPNSYYRKIKTGQDLRGELVHDTRTKRHQIRSLLPSQSSSSSSALSSLPCSSGHNKAGP